MIETPGSTVVQVAGDESVTRVKYVSTRPGMCPQRGQGNQPDLRTTSMSSITPRVTIRSMVAMQATLPRRNAPLTSNLNLLVAVAFSRLRTAC